MSAMSRSTWACELKSNTGNASNVRYGHAPRERVSWNDFNLIIKSKGSVTLHVSVWVEMPQSHISRYTAAVTLHVSVWVEISNAANAACSTTSRSTWACELKSEDYCKGRHCKLSRSTWACELKFSMGTIRVHPSRHAPRERVSWNCWYCKHAVPKSVTLHVSVWVEISTIGTLSMSA